MVWTERELEKEFPKLGIVSRSTKDVIKELEGEGITREKIGTSVYIWAFTSENNVDKQKQLKELELEIFKTDNTINLYQQRIESAKKTRVAVTF